MEGLEGLLPRGSGPSTSHTRSAALGFGTQIDVQPISDGTVGGAWGDGVTGRAVARYVGKYVTKSAESAGATPRPIKRVSDLEYLHLPAHTARMARACFDLAAIPAYGELNLRKWAHMLGYRGHCATKSRVYSVTYGQLRQDRRQHRDAERRARHGLPELGGRLVVIDSEWTVIQTGLSYGERPIVDAIRLRQRTAAAIRAQRAAS
ncbi:replication initiator [Dactylosporangium sp. NPDC000244]|uniref:replication initiator n=1 Tax=Dactylosporangium sp. NPDC000244 TaxID=3154365 RepID=UPI003329EACB